jgi:hypothetical protein
MDRATLKGLISNVLRDLFKQNFIDPVKGTLNNNISVISWWSVLLVEETGVPGEKHRPAASH